MTPNLPSAATPNPFPFRPDSPIPPRTPPSKWVLRVCLLTLAFIAVTVVSIRYYQQWAAEADFRAALDADRAKLASGQWSQQSDALTRVTELGPKAAPALPEVIALLDAADRPDALYDLYIIPCLEAIDPAWRTRPETLRLASVWIARMVECVDPKKKSTGRWDEPWAIAKWNDSIRRLQRVAEYHTEFWNEAFTANEADPDGVRLRGRRELIVPLAREIGQFPKLAVELLTAVDPDWASGPEFNETEVGLFYNALVFRQGADPDKGLVEFVTRVPLGKACSQMQNHVLSTNPKRGGKRAALVALLIERIAAEQTPSVAVDAWSWVLRPLDADWVKHPSAAALIPTLLAALSMSGEGDLRQGDPSQWATRHFPAAAWASADLPRVDRNWRANPAVGPTVAKCIEQIIDRREVTHISTRFAAARALAVIGPPARTAIPELVKVSVEFGRLDWDRQSFGDEDRFIAQVVAALVRIDPEWLASKEALTVIPKLAEWAADTGPSHDGIRNLDGHRVAVIRLLARFGPAAKDAVPKLSSVREKDGVGFIRSEADLALREIEKP